MKNVRYERVLSGGKNVLQILMKFPLKELTGICTLTKLTQILLQTATLITDCEMINKLLVYTKLNEKWNYDRNAKYILK